MSDDWLPEPPSRECVKRIGEWIDKMQKLEAERESNESLYKSAIDHALFRSRIADFAVESNKIEGIHHVKDNERMMGKLEEFLRLKKLTVENVCEFNEWGDLRDHDGMNVRVGGRICPPGGEYIKKELTLILARAMNRSGIFREPFFIHKRFEELHPFTDGNGRTGRAIWLWQMCVHHNYDLSLGFLHKYYYQSLDN